MSECSKEYDSMGVNPVAKRQRIGKDATQDEFPSPNDDVETHPSKDACVARAPLAHRT